MRDKKKIEDQIAELRDRVDKLESLMMTHKHDYSDLTGRIPQHKHKVEGVDSSITNLRGPGRRRGGR